MTLTPRDAATALPDDGPLVPAAQQLSRRQVAPPEAGVELRRGSDGRGHGVVATRAFAPGDTVLAGFLIETSTENDAHATQIALDRWARHGGLGPVVNHSCDPNCGVRLNDRDAFDVVARKAIHPGDEIAFDYAMRNYAIEHFPSACLCGAPICRGSITGWKDLPADRKADYGDLVAPYLRAGDARPDDL